MERTAHERVVVQSTTQAVAIQVVAVQAMSVQSGNISSSVSSMHVYQICSL